jgi:hypothetical protein
MFELMVLGVANQLHLLERSCCRDHMTQYINQGGFGLFSPPALHMHSNRRLYWRYWWPSRALPDRSFFNFQTTYVPRRNRKVSLPSIFFCDGRIRTCLETSKTLLVRKTELHMIVHKSIFVLLPKGRSISCVALGVKFGPPGGSKFKCRSTVSSKICVYLQNKKCHHVLHEFPDLFRKLKLKLLRKRCRRSRKRGKRVIFV